MLPKKIPERKCLGCNEMKPKKELIRVIKTPEGQILIDKTGRQNGRGAYICNSIECYQAARKNKHSAKRTRHFALCIVERCLCGLISP